MATPTATTPIASPAASGVAPPSLTIVADQRPSYPGDPVPGGTLRLTRPPADRNDFNPAAFRQDFQIAASYLDPLLMPDPVTMEPGPWLAEAWGWSEGGRVITYRLRPDVVWHDGTPLTAVDVRFSLYVMRDDVDTGVGSFFVMLDEVEALDDRTVQVTLLQPDGSWLFNASTQPIFQRAQYSDHWQARPLGERTLGGFDWRKHPPIGTGPWRIDGWSDERISFARHDRYWAGPPAFDRLTVEWQIGAAERLAAWREGEIDLLWPVRGTDLDRLGERPGRLYAADAASVMFAAFNFANPARAVPGLFDDQTVRRALSLAIARDRYADEVFGGFVSESAVGTVAQPWAHDFALSTPPRDLSRARTLLSEAGWADNDGDGIIDRDGVPFAITVIFRRDSRPELGRVLTRVARDLADVGVALDVAPLGVEEFQARWLETRDYDLIAYAYDLFPGFTDFDLYGSAWDVRTNPRGWNPGGYRNDEVDAAIAEALVSYDVVAQREALRRLQRAADDDLFGLWLGFPQDLILVAAEIEGFQPNKLWQTAETRRLWRAASV